MNFWTSQGKDKKFHCDSAKKSTEKEEAGTVFSHFSFKHIDKLIAILNFWKLLIFMLLINIKKVYYSSSQLDIFIILKMHCCLT